MSDGIRNNHFSILPPVVKNLLIANALFFLAKIVLSPRGIDLDVLFGLHLWQAEAFHFWQPVTYMFMHADFNHLFFNMFALWMFGAAVENTWGEKRFLLYYFITGLGAALAHYLVTYWELGSAITQLSPLWLNRFNCIGASGAVFGVLLAFGMLFPNAQIYVYFLLPIKAKWFVLIYGALELVYGVVGTSDGVAHFAHLGGMVVGLLLILYWRKKKRYDNDFYHYQDPDDPDDF